MELLPLPSVYDAPPSSEPVVDIKAACLTTNEPPPAPPQGVPRPGVPDAPTPSYRKQHSKAGTNPQPHSLKPVHIAAFSEGRFSQRLKDPTVGASKRAGMAPLLCAALPAAHDNNSDPACCARLLLLAEALEAQVDELQQRYLDAMSQWNAGPSAVTSSAAAAGSKEAAAATKAAKRPAGSNR